MVDNEMDNDEETIEYEEEIAPKPWGKRLLTFMISMSAIGGFAMVVVYSYDRGKLSGAEESAPTLVADDYPTRVKPLNPGGMRIPDQDKKIFGELNPNEKMPEMERLLPPPEPVMVRPTLAPKKSKKDSDVQVDLSGQEQRNDLQLKMTEKNKGITLDTGTINPSTSVSTQTREKQNKKVSVVKPPKKKLKSIKPIVVGQNKSDKTTPSA